MSLFFSLFIKCIFYFSDWPSTSLFCNCLMEMASKHYHIIFICIFIINITICISAMTFTNTVVLYYFEKRRNFTFIIFYICLFIDFILTLYLAIGQILSRTQRSHTHRLVETYSQNRIEILIFVHTATKSCDLLFFHVQSI